jgi:2-hydroxychromene-2-carboxylate isomerase
MSLEFDYYYSFRSPYSYLAAPRIEALMKSYDVVARMRIVLPIAVRIPGFFRQVNPLWPPYLMRDAFRISQIENVPYRWPRPDPIVMDIAKGEVAAEQPYIYRVSRMGVAAARAGKGFEFVRRAGHAIWSGEVDDWHDGEHLSRAAAEAGLDPREIERIVKERADDLDEEIAHNEAGQKQAGHWGVPLFVFENEPFFGQDRIGHLIWRMRQRGLKETAA